ncbi:hypothetical protein [Streptosporangium roseum]|uniref:hypothetical protein n=1 Tax=Streptosporangium roseum TaxID=2001 RepID=UPI00331F7C06
MDVTLLAVRSVEARGRILRWLSDRWETADVVCAERHGHPVAGSSETGDARPISEEPAA